MAPALHQSVEDDRAGGFGEPGQLGHRCFRVSGGATGPDADQHDLLELQLAVLDLGDVAQFGGEPGDASERGPVGEVVVALGVEPVVDGQTSGVVDPVRDVADVVSRTGAHVKALDFGRGFGEWIGVPGGVRSGGRIC